MNSFEKLNRIAEILPQVVNIKSTHKIRPGQIHGAICRTLKIPNSIETRKLVRSVMLASGFRPVTIRGLPFFVSYPDANPATAKVRAKKADKSS